MPIILNINDNNLVLQHLGGQIRSQGYAWLRGKEVLFDLTTDNSPVRHCRIAPQEIHSRYWQECSQNAIATNTAGMRHAADLIWKHLGEFKQQAGFEELYLVVPSHFRDENLQLLLGVAKSLEINVKGIVNKAVYAASTLDTTHAFIHHVDVQLHQTVVSKVRLSETACLDSVTVLSDVSIHDLQESLLKVIQQSFITADRFDPLHNAETEQQLFDQLDEAVRNVLQTGKAVIEVKSSGKLYSVTIDQKEIDNAFAAMIRRLQELKLDASYLDFNAAFGGAVPKVLNVVVDGLITEVVTNNAALEGLSRMDTLTYQTEVVRRVIRPVPPKGQNVSHQVDAPTDVAKGGKVGDLLATHCLQFGHAVEINKCRVSVVDGRLHCQFAEEGNVEDWLSVGNLRIINDPNRKTLQADDRLDSPLADGLITAIRVTSKTGRS